MTILVVRHQRVIVMLRARSAARTRVAFAADGSDSEISGRSNTSPRNFLTQLIEFGGERLNHIDLPSILGSSYPIAHDHTNCASLLRMGTQVSDILLPHGIFQDPVG